MKGNFSCCTSANTTCRTVIVDEMCVSQRHHWFKSHLCWTGLSLCPVWWRCPRPHQRSGTHSRTSSSLQGRLMKPSGQRSSGRSRHGWGGPPSGPRPHEAPPLLSSRTTRLCRGRNLSRGRWLERRETSGGEKSWEALGRKKKDSLWVIITYCTLITSFLFDPIHFALVVCVNKRDKWTNWDVSERQRLKWCKDTGVDDVTSK